MYPIKMHCVCVFRPTPSSHLYSWGRGAGVLPVVLGLMLVLGVCGCHKTPAAPPAAAADASAAPLPPPGPQAAPVTAIDRSPQDIHNMERALVGWVIRNHQRPKSFEEFVASSGIQVPPPPAGKKYVIAKNMHIVLVDQ